MSLKILLADDSLTAQNMGKKILTEAGYEVIAVSNGAQALKKIAAESPDLVVLDVYMPGYSGVELCERMRNSRETARTPVVLSVGKMEAFKPEEVTRVRADGLIIKPFEATELLAVVKKLGEKVPPRPKRQPQAEDAPQVMVEAAPSEAVPAEPVFEVPPPAIEIPREIASTPVIGMDLIPDEAPQAAAPMAAAPIEFDIERDPEPVKTDEGPRMVSAAGLSGVFEMEPAPHPVDEKPVPPAPVEEFERFSTPPEPPADSGATIEHDFQTDPQQGPVPEAQQHPEVEPVKEARSAPTAEPTLSEYAVERFDHVPPLASLESAPPQAPEILPELTSWDEPAAPLPADTSHVSAAPAPDSYAAEFRAAGPVWVAEEVEIEPHEIAIPLHQQMHGQVEADEPLEFDPPARPGVSPETPVPRWEATEPFPEPTGSVDQVPDYGEAAIQPEFEPFSTAPEDAPETQSAYADLADSGPDSPVGEPQPSPDPASDMEQYAAPASEFVPPVTIPTVTEAPADPARIARIVEQVLERLKPEVIAAVTRELENKGQ